MRPGCGCTCAESGLGRGVRWAYLYYPAARPLCTYPCHRSPSGRQGGSQPCGCERVSNRRLTRINADIVAKIRLYLNFNHIIKLKSIMAVICVHLCVSVVNNEIEIITACLFSAHVLSMGWEWCVRAVASGVGRCCRRWVRCWGLRLW